MYTIKEVSRKLNIPTYTLRFWEKNLQELLKPIRTKGGQRRYSEEDFMVIEKIRFLVEEKGVSLKGVKKILINGRDYTGFTDNDEIKELYNILEETINSLKERIEKWWKIKRQSLT